MPGTLHAKSRLTLEPLRALRSEDKGQAGACPDRTRAIPCKVEAVTGQEMSGAADRASLVPFGWQPEHRGTLYRLVNRRKIREYLSQPRTQRGNPVKIFRSHASISVLERLFQLRYRLA